MSSIVLLALLSILAAASHPAAAGAIFVNPGDPDTGHPARAWTDAEKAIVNEALSEWKTFVENFDQVFGTWTLRWEDTDFFKDFRVPGGGDNFGGDPGVTVRPGSFAAGKFPSPPKDSPDFPEGEIYFNTGIMWFFDPTPATDDPGELPNDKVDFLTVAKHEVGHAIGIVGHLPDKFGGAMEEIVSEGERDRVSELDVIFYRQQARVPEPSTVVSVAAGFLTLGGFAWRRRRRA